MLDSSEKRINDTIEQRLAEFERRTAEVLTRMENTVEQSRTNYENLFAPAVSAFETKSTALVNTTHEITEREIKEWNQTHWQSVRKNLVGLLAAIVIIAVMNIAASIYLFTHR